MQRPQQPHVKPERNWIMEIYLAKLWMFRVQQKVSFAGRHRRNRKRDRTPTPKPLITQFTRRILFSDDQRSRARTCRAVRRTNAPESRERLTNGFRSCKPRGRLSNSSGHRPVVHHTSAEDAVFDSHQDVYHFLITLVGLSGFKRSLGLKRRVRRTEPVDRFLPNRAEIQ